MGSIKRPWLAAPVVGIALLAVVAFVLLSGGDDASRPTGRLASAINYDQQLQNIEDSPKVVTLRAPGMAASDVQFEFAKPAHGTLGAPTAATCSEGICVVGVLYTPERDYNGPDRFTYKVRTRDGLHDGTVSIDMAPQNDAPTLVIADRTEQPNVRPGPQTVPNFATQVAPGPGEDGQKTTLKVEAANPAQFAVQPSISPDGTLSFTPAANLPPNTTATVNVTLTDDGGTANGGTPSTTTQVELGLPPSDCNFACLLWLVKKNRPVPAFVPQVPGLPQQQGNAPKPGIPVINLQLNRQSTPINEGGVIVFNGPNLITVNAPGPSSQLATVTLTASDGFLTLATVSGLNFSAGPATAAPAQASGAASAAATASAPAIVFQAGDGVMDATMTFTGTIDEINAALNGMTLTLPLNFAGTVTVTITVTTVAGTTTQVLSFTINPVNDAPAGADNVVATTEGIPLVFTAAMFGYTDPFDTPPNAFAGVVITTPPSQGSLTLNGNPVGAGTFVPIAAINAGQLTFTAALGQFGTPFASFTFQVKDNGGTDNGGVDTDQSPNTMTINVASKNDAPSFVKGPDQAFNEDAGAQSIAGWATAISPGPPDEAGQLLDFIVTNDNNGLFSAQPAVAPNGTLTFASAANANGVANVTLRLHDNGGTAGGGVDTSAPQTFVITINAINDPPVNAVPAAPLILEDVAAPITGLQIADSDAGSSPVQATVTVTNGTVNVTAPGGVTTAGNGTANLQLTGPVAGINQALATLTYTSTLNYNGPANLQIVTDDQGNTGGPAQSDTDNLALTVTPVNDAPLLQFNAPKDKVVNEDAGPQSANQAITSPGPANEGGQLIDYIVTNDNNALFSVQPAIAPNGSLTYTPAPNANGSATVTVAVHDNGGTANGGIDTSPSQTFTITVNAVNDPPLNIVPAGPLIAFEDTDFPLNGLSSLSTSDDSGPNPILVTVSVTNGTLTAGVTSGVVIGTNGTASVTLTGQLNNVVSALNTLVYRANLNYAGPDTLQIVTNDQGNTGSGGPLTDTDSVAITVTPVNDAPSFTLVAAPNQTVNEDAGAQTPGGVIATFNPGGGADEVGQTPTYLVTNNANALFSVQPAIAANGNLTYTPAANANGVATVSVRVQDSGGTANGGVDISALPALTFTITINAINDAPGGTDNTVSTVESTPRAFLIADFGFTDTLDTPPNALGRVRLTTLPALGTISLTGSANPAAGDFITAADISAGKLIFTPAANANGSPYTTFTFQVEDDGATGGANVNLDPVANTLTINVNPVNTPPTGTDNTIALNEDDVRVFLAADFGFSDAGDAPSPNNFLAVKIASLPLAGTLTFNSNPVTPNQFIPVANFATFTFTPAANASGTPYTSFTFQVQDDGGSLAGSDLDPIANTITFNVAPLNDAPLGVANTINATEDTAYTFSAIDFGFSDPNDTPANNFSGVVVTTVPSLGVLKDGAIVVTAGYFVPAINFGSFTYTPQPANANGSPYTTFTFKVQDDGSGVAPNVNQDPTARTMTINVTPANDTPTDLILTVTAPDTQDGANNVFIASSTVASGTTIGTLSATDTDDVPPNNFIFSVQGGVDAAKFTVTGTSFKTNAILDGNVQATYNVILRVTDDGTPAPLVRDEAFVINLNRAPTDIQVSANNVNENSATPTSIGTLTATDPDPAPAFTFTIVASDGLVGPGHCGLGSTFNNADFDVFGGTTLRAISAFNYEAQTPRTKLLCMQVADQFNSTYQELLTVNLVDVNEQPVVTPTGPFSVPENSTAATNVGTPVLFADPERDGGPGAANDQTYVYSIQSGNTGNAFAINATTGQLTVATPSAVNFETSPTFSLVIRVTDAGGAAVNPPGVLNGETTVTVNLTDANEVPVAVAASHNVAGNINISTAAGNLFTGATDPDAADNTGSFAAHHTASAVNNLAGRLVVNTDGSYTYNPPVGAFTGSEVGTFKICDDGGDNTPPGPQQCSADTNITFNFSEGIWFVNSGSGCVSACDGRLTNPFTSIGTLQTAQGTANGPAANESIFIYENTAEYTGPLTLLAGQKLFGQDATTTLSALTGVTPPADSAALPTLAAGGTTVRINSAGTTLTLNNTAGNNTVRGLTLTNATTMALTGSTFGALTISEVSIDNTLTGGAISLTTGSLAAGATIDSLKAAPGVAANGILLSGITSGSLAVNGGANLNANSTGAAVSVVGGVVGLTYSGGALVNQGGSGAVVSVSGGHISGTVTFNGSVTATAGSGLQFDNADGTYNFNGPSSTLTGAGLTAGVNIVNGSGGTFLFGSGTQIFNPTGTAFNASSSSANVTYNGTISKSSAGAGVNLNANTGTVSFTGALTLTTSTGVAFNATGGGTVTATNTTSTLSTTTATALNVNATTIGAGGLKFTSITSTGGSANGIILDTTGVAGGLTVTGNNAAGTGGTISSKTGADGSTTQGSGIYLNSTTNPSFSWMQLNDFQNYGIVGTSVSGLTLNRMVVNGSNGTLQGGIGEGSVYFTGLSGSATVSNSTFAGGAYDTFHVFNNGGQNLNRITITNSSFAMTNTLGNDALAFQATNGVFNATVQSSFFTAARGDLFQLDMHGTLSSDLIFGGLGAGNTLTNNNANIVSGGGGITVSSGGAGDAVGFTFNISNNSMRDALGSALGVSSGSGNSSFTGTINANTIGVTGVANSGSAQGSGIGFVTDLGANSSVTITNNIVRQYGGITGGILVQYGDAVSGGNAQLTAVVQGNTVAEPATAFGQNGITVNFGTTAGDAGKLCLTLGGSSPNFTGGSNGGAGATDIRVRQRFDTRVGLLDTPNYAGPFGLGQTASVNAYIASKNTGTVSSNDGLSGGFFGTCPP